MVTRSSFALETELRTHVWSFQRDDGTLIQPAVEFLRSSRLKNLHHDNETSWTIDDGVLAFRNRSGAVTTRFDTVTRSAAGVPTLSGAYLGADPAGIRHVLLPRARIVGPRSGRRVPVCLVVPIHPPYFIYGVNLAVQSLFAEYRLCFVFTSHAERLQFAGMIQDGPAVDYLWIVLEDHAPVHRLETVGRQRSFPSFKKFTAVRELSPHFDFILCVDAETFILRETGWHTRCAEIFERKFWCGGTLTPSMGPELAILRASACDLAPESDKEGMARLVDHVRAYTWWWDLPVYRTAGIDDFFTWIGWDDQDAFVAKLTYPVFDHTAYQYYLVLKEGFSVRRDDQIVHSLEFSDAVVVKYAHTAVAAGAWVNAHAYLQDPRYFREQHYLAVYHLDRTAFPQFTRMA